MSSSILIVEDEIVIARDIQFTLEQLGFKVVGIANNSQKAIDLFEKYSPQIVLMDIFLSDEVDGITTAHKLQETKKPFSLIYLTAYADDETIDRAALTNPSSYILKPFKTEEINVALKLAKFKLNPTKQSQKNTEDRIDLKDGYYYKTNSKKLYFNDEPILLGKKEFLLLQLLIDARGNIVDYETIDNYIWPHYAVEENIRRNLIYRLKTKLNHSIIETVPRMGYRIQM